MSRVRPSFAQRRSHRAAAITFETVRQIGLSLPHVVDALSYNAPALKVKGKLFVRLREDLDSIVIKIRFDERAELIAANPTAYYITDHYLRYEWMLVRLSEVRLDALRELLQAAYGFALAPKSR